MIFHLDSNKQHFFSSTLQNIHHSTTIDPSTGDIVPWAGRGRACVLATPTAVNYKQCYENLDRHSVMVCAQLVVWFVLLFIHLVMLCILYKGNGDAHKCNKVHIWTDILQGGALIMVLSSPDKQTGLATIYECLLAAHIFGWISLLLFMNYFTDDYTTHKTRLKYNPPQ